MRLLVFAATFEILFFCFYLLIGAGHGSYRQNVCNWDCNWYRTIAQNGYAAHVGPGGRANWAFFPLFPLLSAALMGATAQSFVTCASVLNFGLLFALVVAGAGYARERFDVGDRAFVAMVFLSFPFGIYFRLPYTESLYGLLVVLALILAHRRRLLLAGLCAGLACACRPTGVLLVGSIGAVIGLSALVAGVRGQITWAAVARQMLRLAGFGLLGVSGLIAYSVFLELRVGDPLAFSHAMASWDRHYANPVGRIVTGLSLHDMTAANFLTMTYRSQTYLALAALASLPLIAYATWRRAYVEALFLLATLILSSATGLESEPRYMFCNPVSITLLAVMLARLPLPVRWSVPAFFGAAQVVLVFAWFNLSAFMT